MLTVELVGGGRYSGNVYVDGRPVCDSSWDLADASTVCRMLFPNITSSAVEATTGSAFGFTGGSFSMTNMTCRGNETNINTCQHDILNVTPGCSCSDFVNKNGYGRCKYFLLVYTLERVTTNF